MTLSQAIKAHHGTQICEWLSELRQIRKRAKIYEHFDKTGRLFMVDVVHFTFKNGKEVAVDGGYANFFARDKETAQILIRKACISTRDKLNNKNKKANARVEVSYNENLIKNGKCRVYFTGADKKSYYIEFRILEFPLCDKNSDMTQIIGD